MTGECKVSPECLSVVIPAYNEEATLIATIQRVLVIPNLHEVVIVDDGSTDGTGRMVDDLCSRYPKVKALHHTFNQGKTEALKTGFAATSGQIVIVQDADLEYDPSEIEEVIAPIVAGHADVVYGSRFMVRKAARALYFYHYIANRALTFLSNLFTNINLTDVETGYKAFRGDIIRKMRLVSVGFGFEIEVTAKVAKLNCRIYEVPISYRGRTYAEGKKIGIWDGIAAVWYILRFNLLCSLKKSYELLPIDRATERVSDVVSDWQP
jgi:glycosyltransferase involved in cell wall biosynthesis